MDELSVQCSIHLDNVPLKEIKTFKCGHGFCETCLAVFFSTNGRKPCPVCRQLIKHADARSVYLNAARGLTQHPAFNSSPRIDIDLTCSEEEGDSSIASASTKLKEKTRKLAAEIIDLSAQLRSAQRRAETLKGEKDTLELDCEAARAENSTLIGKNTKLERDHFTLEKQNSTLKRQHSTLEREFARLETESKQLAEDNRRLVAEASKARTDRDEALKEAGSEKERVSKFQDWLEDARKQIGSQKAKIKGLNQTNSKLKLDVLSLQCEQVPVEKHQDSLMVVERENYYPEDEEDWLGELCAADLDEPRYSATPSDDELILSDPKASRKRFPLKDRPLPYDRNDREGTEEVERPLPDDRRPPLARFPSDWTLGAEGSMGQVPVVSSKKRKHTGDAIIGTGSAGQKFVKVKVAGPSKGKERAGEQETEGRGAPATLVKKDKQTKKPSGPISIDRSGHVVGTVALGSRQKMSRAS